MVSVALRSTELIGGKYDERTVKPCHPLFPCLFSLYLGMADEQPAVGLSFSGTYLSCVCRLIAHRAQAL